MGKTMSIFENFEAYLGTAITMSLPPQTMAYAVACVWDRRGRGTEEADDEYQKRNRERLL